MLKQWQNSGVNYYNMAKKKEKIKEGGIEFDSWGEVHFWWWCKTLIKAGYIKDVQFQPKSFELTKPLVIEYYKPMKRIEGKYVPEEVMKGNVYTCDAKIIWEEKANNIFFTDINSDLRKKKDNALQYFLAKEIKDHNDEVPHSYYSYIEIKPLFDQNNMTRLAKTNIKWVFDKYGEFVNLVIPEKLFNKTFTPMRFLYCNINSHKKRTLKIKEVRSLKHFLDKFSLDS